MGNEATDGKQASEAVQRLKLDVVILDVTMPTMSGLQAAPQIAKLAPGCRILIFTMHETGKNHERCVCRGRAWLRSEVSSRKRSGGGH
jgi:DNA-binding NarL/FixJ family response regulator